MTPKVSNYIRRYFLLTCGLAIMATGVAFSILANIGISPISCLPYVLHVTNSFLSVGQYTALMHIGFVLVQIVLLRRNYELYQLLQLGVAVALGLLIDLALMVFSFLQPTHYVEQLALFAVSVILVGFGMFLEVKAEVLMVAGEGMVKAIASVTQKEFGKIKVLCDSLLVLISLIIGLVFSQKVIGIREGTILAALLVGLSIRFFNSKITFLGPFLKGSCDKADETLSA